MSEKLKLKLERIGNGVLVPALTKLCNLNIHSGRDTYALMRTLEKLNPEIEAFRKTKESLLKKHGGESNLTALRAEVAATAEGSPERAAADKRLTALLPYEALQIKTNAPGYAPFLEEMANLHATEIELFLDHKVPLALEKLDSTFTPFELKELTETIVEIIA